MTRICWWWLVDSVSRLLEPDERDAVQGDFAERGVTNGKALLDLLGLVARRQAALWKDWRPWLALAGVVGPIALLLIDFYLSLGRGSDLVDLHLWMIYGVIDQTGLTAGPVIGPLVCYSLLLVTWSGTSGFALGSLSRRTIWVNGPLFCGLFWLLFSDVLSAAVPPKLSTVLLVSTALFLLPFIWGVHQGLRLGTLGLLRGILVASAVASLTALAIWTGGWWPGAGWQTRQIFLSTALLWPVGYLVAKAGWRQLAR
jgi:hypothetical protein